MAARLCGLFYENSFLSASRIPFIPIQEFRALYNLPQEFGVALFQPKDYTELGSLEGADLQTLRNEMLASFPIDYPAIGWMAFSIEYQCHFRRKLYEINPTVRLHPSEIEYAVSGFAGLFQAYIYAVLKAQMHTKPLPNFQDVFYHWLARTILVSQKIYLYPYKQDVWRIQIVKHHFGRIGLVVCNLVQQQAVYDRQLACPAEEFMVSLLDEICCRTRTLIVQQE